MANEVITGIEKDKPVKSIKVNAGQASKLEKALDDLEAHHGEFIAAWPQYTEQQRRDVLEHSPIFARLTAMTDPLRG